MSINDRLGAVCEHFGVKAGQSLPSMDKNWIRDCVDMVIDESDSYQDHTYGSDIGED